jgi:hypothetical protein
MSLAVLSLLALEALDLGFNNEVFEIYLVGHIQYSCCVLEPVGGSLTAERLSAVLGGQDTCLRLPDPDLEVRQSHC